MYSICGSYRQFLISIYKDHVYIKGGEERLHLYTCVFYVINVCAHVCVYRYVALCIAVYPCLNIPSVYRREIKGVCA